MLPLKREKISKGPLCHNCTRVKMKADGKTLCRNGGKAAKTEMMWKAGDPSLFRFFTLLATADELSGAFHI